MYLILYSFNKLLCCSWYLPCTLLGTGHLSLPKTNLASSISPSSSRDLKTSNYGRYQRHGNVNMNTWPGRHRWILIICTWEGWVKLHWASSFWAIKRDLWSKNSLKTVTKKSSQWVMAWLEVCDRARGVAYLPFQFYLEYCWKRKIVQV